MKKSMFRLLSLLGTVAILVGSLSIGALFTGVSAATTTVWDGQAADITEGDGSAENPYLIENGGQLYTMVTTGAATAGKYYKLTQDIYLNDVSNADWKNGTVNSWPNRKIFYGNVNGDGHVVYGLYSVADERVGLIPEISGTVSITNLGLENSYLKITGWGYIGGLVGYVYAGTSFTVNYCYVGADVEIANPGSSGGQAGLVGYVDNGDNGFEINYCYSLASLTGPTALSDSRAVLVGRIGDVASGGSLTSRHIRYSYGIAPNAPDIFPLASYGWHGCRADYWQVYATTKGNSEAGTYYDRITVLTADQMQGTAAKTNMGGLDWTNVWKVNKNGYPTLRVFMSAEEIAYENSLWNGQAADITEGDGSAENPYLIENGGQLYTMVTTGAATAGKYYKITKDIYLNDVRDSDWATDTANNNWPMAKTFYGNLDGDGHVVYGLYSVRQEQMGLLPHVSGTVSVKNLGVDKAYLTSNNANAWIQTGTLVGVVDANTTLTVDQCYAGQDVEIHCLSSVYGLGGLIGNAGNGTAVVKLNYSYSLAKITGENVTAGTSYDSWGLLVGIMGSAGQVRYSYAVNTDTSETALKVPVLSSTWPAAVSDAYFIYGTDIAAIYASGGKYSETNAAKNTHVLTADKMQGAAAKTNMGGLDFNTVFYTTDSYPALRVFQVGKLSLADSSAAVYCEKATGNTYMTDADKGNYGAFRLLGNYATADGDAAKIIPEGADGTAYKVVERGIIMGKGTRTEMDLSKAVGYVNLKQAGEDTSAATCYYVLSKTENFDNCWTLDENGKLQYSLLVNRVFNTAFDTEITFRPYVKVRVGGADYTLYAEARTVTYRQLVGLAQEQNPTLDFGWMN